ncbi:MAG: hypothetical protein WBS22_16680, partial [Methylocystis sp.]
MSKKKSPISQSAPAGGLVQRRQDAAGFYIGNQQRSDNRKPLLAAAPVGFMDLRYGMCRWPISGPHHLAQVGLIEAQAPQPRQWDGRGSPPPHRTACVECARRSRRLWRAMVSKLVARGRDEMKLRLGSTLPLLCLLL